MMVCVNEEMRTHSEGKRWKILAEDEGDYPLLTDSGTESYTESPIAEEESESSDTFAPSPCQSEDSTIAIDIDSEKLQNKNEEGILKALCQSLNGLRCEQHAEYTSEHFSEYERPSSSILRRSSYHLDDKEYLNKSEVHRGRQVSFPDDESSLAIYKEPDYFLPWIITKKLTAEEIVQEYENSCKRHQAIELDVVKKQLRDVKNNLNRSSILNLSAIQISNEVCETLEDLFKIMNFRVIHLSESKFTQETIHEFLNMLEYYEPTTELVINEFFNDLEAWKSLCNYISRSCYLESLIFKDMTINEQYMRFLLTAVNVNENISSLTFDSCNLDKTPSYLVDSLMNNTSIQELYLLQIGLYTKEADCLGRYLSKNFFLQVLDLSNNFVGDRGLEVLAKGLSHQQSRGTGLSVLILVNNQLTEKCGPTINFIITNCVTLRTLNIGYNNLTDEVILRIQEGLTLTSTLEGLGLQSTLITCSGAFSLAEAIENNHSLEKINLKGNKAIQTSGLERLCQALTNSKVIKVELDEHNRSCNDPRGYNEIVKKINGICTINRSLHEQKSEEDPLTITTFPSRKVSLSCEPRYTSPPITSETCTTKTVSTSSPRNRFQVLKVSETSLNGPPSIGNSRFRVFTVTTPSAEININENSPNNN